MIGFKYDFYAPYSITKEITKIIDYSLGDILILAIGIPTIIFFIYFIIPYLDIYLLVKKEKKEEFAKKKSLKKIILQKDLEDLIVKELENKSSV